MMSAAQKLLSYVIDEYQYFIGVIRLPRAPWQRFYITNQPQHGKPRITKVSTQYISSLSYCLIHKGFFLQMSIVVDPFNPRPCNLFDRYICEYNNNVWVLSLALNNGLVTNLIHSKTMIYWYVHNVKARQNQFKG